MLIHRQEIFIVTTVDHHLFHWRYADQNDYIRMTLDYELFRIAAVVT
jgi:hypothetical protein